MDSTILVLHHPLALSTHGTTTLHVHINHFIQEKTPVLSPIHEVHTSWNLDALGRETVNFFFWCLWKTEKFGLIVT